MVLRPICEPVELPLGASILAERITIAPAAPAIGRFMHFHDVAELVLFRRVRGEFIADGRRHRLGDGAIVFVPSMRHHDFVLERGAMEWVLVQIDPYLVEALALRPEMARLARPFCAWPGDLGRARTELLADWLVESAKRGAADPAIERIVELLLLSAVEAPERVTVAEAGSSDFAQVRGRNVQPLPRLLLQAIPAGARNDLHRICARVPAASCRPAHGDDGRRRVGDRLRGGVFEPGTFQRALSRTVRYDATRVPEQLARPCGVIGEG